MSTQTLIGVGTLPMVNLLPPEIGERRKLRRLQTSLGAGVLASVAVVGALFFVAQGEVSSAQNKVEATKAEGISLQAQTAKYADVPAIIAKVDAAKLQRSQAMAGEIRWSFYLNDLSLRIPAKVWLTSLTASPTGATTGTAGTTASAPAATAYAVPGIASLIFEGKAYRHNDVATWLEMLAHEKGWTQPYFTTSTVDDTLKPPTGDHAVSFSSTVTVTEGALSRRFEEKAGS